MIQNRPLGFLVGSIALLTLTVAYAASLDHWGDTKTLLFLIVGLVSLATAGIASVQLIQQRAASEQAP